MLHYLNEAPDALPVGIGQGPWFEPVELCMLWPWLDTTPERVEAAGDSLALRFWNANRRWNEAETKRSVILPILTEILGFPNHEITESPIPIARHNGTALLPDYLLPHACVIEAKRIGVSLLSYASEESNFFNPLDQGLSYLDTYDTRSCIVTNGWDWYAFRRANDHISGSRGADHYFGARFRLDDVIESGDRTRLGQFLSMFNATCLSGRANRAVPITGFQSLGIGRGLYDLNSMLHFVNASDQPLRGRGSGFHAPLRSSWSM